MALKPKASASGDLLKGDAARSNLFSNKHSRIVEVGKIGITKWDVKTLV